MYEDKSHVTIIRTVIILVLVCLVIVVIWFGFYATRSKTEEPAKPENQLTVEGDDICKPCLYYCHYQCQDSLVHTTKQHYNQLLDQRIIQFYQLYDMSYSALSLCEILLEHHEMIEQVWKEEPAELTQKRHDFFVKGAELYIHQYGIIK